MGDGVDLVVLDCDGVLVDSEPISVRVEVELLAELGWPLGPDEVVERFVGRSDSHMAAEVATHVGVSATDFLDRYRSRLDRALAAEVEPVAGVVEALDRLDARGVPTCVASSGTHDKMRITLGRTGLLERFDGRIFSATEVDDGKPAPDLFLHAARSMGADPQRCVVVEDSPAGIEAARAAGMRSLAYTGSVTDQLLLAGPGTVVFDDMAQLPRLVELLGAA